MLLQYYTLRTEFESKNGSTSRLASYQIQYSTYDESYSTYWTQNCKQQVDSYSQTRIFQMKRPCRTEGEKGRPRCMLMNLLLSEYSSPSEQVASTNFIASLLALWNRGFCIDSLGGSETSGIDERRFEEFRFATLKSGTFYLPNAQTEPAPPGLWQFAHLIGLSYRATCLSKKFEKATRNHGKQP